MSATHRALHICISCRKAGSAHWFEHEHSCPASLEPEVDEAGQIEDWDVYKARSSKFGAEYRKKNKIKDTDVFDTGL